MAVRRWIDVTTALEPAATSVLHRGLSILECFDSSQGIRGITLTELARMTDLPKATVHRLCAQLVELDYLAKADGRYYLGYRIFLLSSQVIGPKRLQQVAAPHLQDLHSVCRTNVQLGTISNGTVIYLARITRERSLEIGSHMGPRLPAYCSALGKAMLAFGHPDHVREQIARGMPRRTRYTMTDPRELVRAMNLIRERGYSVNQEESRLGWVGVGAPLLNRDGGVIAGLSIIGRSSLDMLKFAPAVRKTAAAIATDFTSTSVTYAL
jgi:DNA-binding IclR family transcriptional regulator